MGDVAGMRRIVTRGEASPSKVILRRDYRLLVINCDCNWIVKASELRRWLRKQGCSFVEGTRHTMVNRGNRTSAIPRHPSEEIKTGRHHKILRDPGAADSIRASLHCFAGGPLRHGDTSGSMMACWRSGFRSGQKAGSAVTCGQHLNSAGGTMLMCPAQTDVASTNARTSGSSFSGVAG